MSLPAAVDVKRSKLDIVSRAAAEYITVMETVESFLKSVYDAASKQEPSGTAVEQLRHQQV